MASRGSVIPHFVSQIKNNQPITITDPKMTRFSLTMDEALDFILQSTFLGKGSEVFVPKLCAYSIMDLKNAVSELIQDTGETRIPVRPGEKLHQTLINNDEIKYAWQLKDKFVIFSPLKAESEIKKEYPGIKKPKLANSYSSNSVDKISVGELKSIIATLNF